MRVLISPSVLAADFSCLGDEIARAVEGGCDSFHVDIMDHHFVPNLSFGPAIMKTVRKLTTLPIDVHLMVDNPLDMLDAFCSAGADSITVHVEVFPDVRVALDAIAKRGVLKGLSLKPDSPVATVTDHIGLVDLILVMSVYPGFGGQRFMESSYDRIRAIGDASRKSANHPAISVDGGVDASNAAQLADAGATSLVAGSSVFRNHEAAANVRKIRDVLDRR